MKNPGKWRKFWIDIFKHILTVLFCSAPSARVSNHKTFFNLLNDFSPKWKPWMAAKLWWVRLIWNVKFTRLSKMPTELPVIFANIITWLLRNWILELWMAFLVTIRLLRRSPLFMFHHICTTSCLSWSRTQWGPLLNDTGITPSICLLLKVSLGQKFGNVSIISNHVKNQKKIISKPF